MSYFYDDIGSIVTRRWVGSKSFGGNPDPFINVTKRLDEQKKE